MKSVILIKDMDRNLVNFDNISSINGMLYIISAKMNSGERRRLFQGTSTEVKQWFLWLDEQFKSLSILRPRIAVLNYPDDVMDLCDFADENILKVEEPKPKVPKTENRSWFKDIF